MAAPLTVVFPLSFSLGSSASPWQDVKPLLLYLGLLLLAACCQAARPTALRDGEDVLFPNGTRVTRGWFPPGFLFGTIISSMKIMDCLVASLSLRARSLMVQHCWSSLLKSVGLCADGNGEANAVAIAHYNEVIDNVLGQGLTPMVSLWTQDHPQALYEWYGGTLGSQFMKKKHGKAGCWHAADFSHLADVAKHGTNFLSIIFKIWFCWTYGNFAKNNFRKRQSSGEPSFWE